MVEIVNGFNNMRSSKFHIADDEAVCNCGCATLCSLLHAGDEGLGVVSCQHSKHTYSRGIHLWERALCPRPAGSAWHALKCLKGECSKCGFQLIPLCDMEVDSNNKSEMEWRRFEMVSAGNTKAGEPKKVIRLEYKRTTAWFFLQFALPKFKPFILHQHTAKWQDLQCKESREKLQPGEILSYIDFAENYSFKGQDEIQTPHWYNWQLTILVHITYMYNPVYDPTDPKSKRLQTEYFYYISDDRTHDSLFVQHCLKLHWDTLKEKGLLPSRHVIWSDGCAAQFKCATAWWFVARYPSITSCPQLPNGCRLEWNFWGSGHGKGPHDGAGACLKQALRKEQLKHNSRQLHDAKDVVDYLEEAMNLPNEEHRRVLLFSP